MARLDLHTHSQASPDGALRATDYKRMLESGKLDYIAITDHDRIDFALQLQAELGGLGILGSRIIVGEEITTQAGEIIGLYLSEAVPPGLTAAETVQRIHRQGGLVYIPHPFETVRKGLTLADLDAIAGEVDIIETYNGRTLQNRGGQAEKWAARHGAAQAASSDAHGWYGWGNTYSKITGVPTRENLAETLQTMTTCCHGSVGVRGRLYPKINRLRKALHRD